MLAVSTALDQALGRRQDLQAEAIFVSPGHGHLQTGCGQCPSGAAVILRASSSAHTALPAACLCCWFLVNVFCPLGALWLAMLVTTLEGREGISLGSESVGGPGP